MQYETLLLVMHFPELDAIYVAACLCMKSFGNIY